jgi:hypothetical protein
MAQRQKPADGTVAAFTCTARQAHGVASQVSLPPSPRLLDGSIPLSSGGLTSLPSMAWLCTADSYRCHIQPRAPGPMVQHPLLSSQLPSGAMGPTAAHVHRCPHPWPPCPHTSLRQLLPSCLLVGGHPQGGPVRSHAVQPVPCGGCLRVVAHAPRRQDHLQRPGSQNRAGFGTHDAVACGRHTQCTELAGPALGRWCMSVCASGRLVVQLSQPAPRHNPSTHLVPGRLGHVDHQVDAIPRPIVGHLQACSKQVLGWSGDC